MAPKHAETDLKYIVIHKLFKKQNEKEVDKLVANELLPLEGTARRFVETFQEANNVKHGLQMGTFIEDKKVYPLQSYIQSYLDDMGPDSFLTMSVRTASLMENCLKNEPRSTGGFLIVFSYDDKEKGPIVAIAMMADKENIGIDGNLHFIRNATLDLEHMNLATTVIVNRWQDKANDKNYLTFMVGLKDISNYYKDKFIGCSDVRKTSTLTRNLMDAVDGFMASRGYDDETMRRARDLVVGYVGNNKEEISLDYVKNLVMPDPEDQRLFDSYVEEHQIELSSSFRPDMRVMNSWKQLVYSAKGIKLSIERKRISDGTVSYDTEQKALVIQDSDSALYSEFRKFQGHEGSDE